MKKAIMYLSGMKSRYFMLLSCLILLVGATSCSSDEFETNLPEEPKQFSKAELIEQALSRMPKTRAGLPYPVKMVTTKKEVIIKVLAKEDIMILWDTDGQELLSAGNIQIVSHHFYEDKLSYGIYIKGSEDAIMWLLVGDNELIHLDVENNSELEFFYCEKNKLDTLPLTGCPNLKTVRAQENELSSIDVTHLPLLGELFLGTNRLTSLNITGNPVLQILWVENNQITDLDFSTNPYLYGININNTAINQLDISNLSVQYLQASNSNLTNFIYTKDNLINSYDLRINGTPFENTTGFYYFIDKLPNRTGKSEGQLWTYASMTDLDKWELNNKNWGIYK